MKVYHWARCSTCTRVREELAERGLAGEERDFFAQPLSRPELEEIAAMAGGMRRLLSVGSPGFRKLGRDPEGLTEAEITDLILSEPRFARRPFAVQDGVVLVGRAEILAGTRPARPA